MNNTIFCDIDGVIADFAGAYKSIFFRDAHEDDFFTVNQMVTTVPDFFRLLPVLPKGRELFDALKDKYNIVFLTTPMQGVDSCARDKAEWIAQNFGNYDIIFSADKASYVEDEKSILIDDMDFNLTPWREAGGTAISFNQSNDKIISKVEDVFNDKKQTSSIIEQINIVKPIQQYKKKSVKTLKKARTKAIKKIKTWLSIKKIGKKYLRKEVDESGKCKYYYK